MPGELEFDTSAMSAPEPAGGKEPPSKPVNDHDTNVQYYSDGKQADAKGGGNGKPKADAKGSNGKPKAEAKDTKADAEDTKEAKPAAPKKRKVKFLGVERELADEDPEEIDLDDHELELKVDGKPQRVRLRDLAKDYELRDASHGRMREAQTIIEGGKAWKQKLVEDPQNIGEYLRDELGLENPYAPLEAEYMSLLELEQLKSPVLADGSENPNFNPELYAQKHHERLEAERVRKERKLQAQQHAESERGRKMELAKQYQERSKVAFKASGLGVNEFTVGVANLIVAGARSAGRQLSPEDLAYETHRAIRGELAKQVKALSLADLLDMRGDGAAKEVADYFATKARDAERAKAEKAAAGSSSDDDGDNGTKRRSKRQYL